MWDNQISKLSQEEIINLNTKTIIDSYELIKLKREVSVEILKLLIEKFSGKKVNQYKKISSMIETDLKDLQQKRAIRISFEKNQWNDKFLDFNVFGKNINFEDKNLFQYVVENDNLYFDKEKLVQLLKDNSKDTYVPTYDEVHSELSSFVEKTDKLNQFIKENFNEEKYIHQLEGGMTKFVNGYISKMRYKGFQLN